MVVILPWYQRVCIAVDVFKMSTNGKMVLEEKTDHSFILPKLCINLLKHHTAFCSSKMTRAFCAVKYTNMIICLIRYSYCTTSAATVLRFNCTTYGKCCATLQYITLSALKTLMHFATLVPSIGSIYNNPYTFATWTGIMSGAHDQYYSVWVT